MRQCRGVWLMISTDDKAIAAAKLAARIAPLLAGREPEVQGAVLADLLAIWLSGHRVEGDPRAEAELREGILALHIAAVRELVELADRERGAARWQH